MTKQESLKLISLIQAQYPGRFTFANEKAMDLAATLWWDVLNDLPYDLIVAATKKHSLSGKFPPTIADLRELTCGVVYPNNTIDSGEAWRLVTKLTRDWGQIDNRSYSGKVFFRRDDIAALPPAVKKAMDAVGYEAIQLREISTESTLRSQFMKIYDQYARRERDDTTTPPQLKSEFERFKITEPQSHLKYLSEAKEELQGELMPMPDNIKAQIRSFRAKTMLAEEARKQAWVEKMEIKQRDYQQHEYKPGELDSLFEVLGGEG